MIYRYFDLNVSFIEELENEQITGSLFMNMLVYIFLLIRKLEKICMKLKIFTMFVDLQICILATSSLCPDPADVGSCRGGCY